MAELVQQKAEEVPLRHLAGQRERTDRVLVVEGVHKGPEALGARVHLPEEDDLRAVHLETRPGEIWLGGRDEPLRRAEGEGQARRNPVTG